MTQPTYRLLGPVEQALIARLLDAAGLPSTDPLRAQTRIAHAPDRSWSAFLDLAVDAGAAPASSLPDGPVPGRLAALDADGEVAGEILVWLADGLLTGLEYAWYTDEPPTGWPAIDRLEPQ